MKLFNFSFRGECNYPEHKGGKCYFVNLCVCVCVMCVCVCVCVCMCVCFYFYLKKSKKNKNKNMKQCLKKNQPKKIMH